MKKVIVTGGTGYIGSHTVVEFLNISFEVVIIDNLSNSDKNVLQGIAEICGKQPIFYELDLCDSKSLDKIISKHSDADAIVHFAAYKAVGESVKNPIKYYHNNLCGLVNLLETADKYGLSNFVFSSSCTVYGQPEKLPVTETSPIQKAESPYGNTKKIAEDILTDYTNSKEDFNCISLRYFNPIGAHPTAKIGELPLGVPDNLLPYITQTGIGIREQLSVFGDDYNTPDGTAIRDYINVVDLAKAHVVAINRLIKKENVDKFEVYNVGTGKGVSVLEIIKTFEKVSKLKLNYKIVERRKGDIEKVWADTTKANNILGWQAEKSLSETILSAWKWEKYIRKEYKKA